MMKCVFARSLWAGPVAALGLLMVSNVSAQVVLPQQDANCLSCHSGEPATLANLIVDEVSACDYSDADLYDGWGWNAVEQESCPPVDSSAAEGAYLHDNSAAAPLPDAQPLATSATVETVFGVPVCALQSSDPDGDGWGWEGNRTCIVERQTTQNDNLSAGSAVCIDSDGDGWGWDGERSCVVADTAETVDTADSAVEQHVAICVDTDGDGYGWDGSGSCDPNVSDAPVIDDFSGCSLPAAGTTVVSSTGPIRSTGNSFFPDNGPQCVVPENQFNGPGLRFGDFLLLNNAWNGDKSTYSWTQCIALSANNDGSVVPSWTYDWGNEDDLRQGFQEWEVKSFPEIVYGVKSQTESSAECGTTGLPVAVNSLPEIDITYSYRAPQTNSRQGDLFDANGESQTVYGGDRNVAIESFLHSSCEITRGANSNLEFELMVWLEHGNERLPSGSPPVSVFTDSAGRHYDIYVKGAADPGYIAYVAQETATSGTLNWNEFFADARSNASTYGVNAIDTNWCMANILFGTEIWWGEGSFTVDYLQIQRQY